MIAHYINRGHSLEEMLSLTYLERMFFMAAWEIEVEEVAKSIGSN